jgi:hypothetical protein
MAFVEVRLRTRISEAELEEKKGKILTDEDYNLLLTRDARVLEPSGQPLLIYQRGVIPEELREQTIDVLHSLKDLKTTNRGLASGTKRVARAGGKAKRTEAKPIASAIIGAFDPMGPKQFCRLTAWTGQETEKFRVLWPLLEFIGGQMAMHAPERYAAQMEYVRRTQPEWVIPGTPFTTVTVNNSYPTGVHTDKGDLDEGISTLACFRRGKYTGGILVFPEYRVAVDMQDRDLLLMNAHRWHGNTAIICACGKSLDEMCPDCGAERISVVSYYRTRMVTCGSAADEAEKARIYAEQRNRALLGE